MKCWLCSQEVPQKARNYKHHCKLFVLFKIGYENWEPGESSCKMTDDQFRESVLIMVGHCDRYYDFDGNMKFKAKSISYSSLGQEGFEKVYNRCLHFIADKLLKCGKSDLHDMVVTGF